MTFLQGKTNQNQLDARFCKLQIVENLQSFFSAAIASTFHSLWLLLSFLFGQSQEYRKRSPNLPGGENKAEAQAAAPVSR